MKEVYYTTERSQQIILSLLKASGIRKVVASPGTTNITLVASMQYDPWFEMYSSADERSAAYMACGLAAESGEAVVITCTGATASRNYLPGLTEAYYRKLPILAITANQGTSKVGHLIPQNIDRSVLANDVAVLSVNIPVTRNDEDEWNCQIQVNKAINALFKHGGGPVHINMATDYGWEYNVKQLPRCRKIKHIMGYDSFPLIPEGKIAIFIGSHKKFSEEETFAIDTFCASHNAVVFCDHTSGYYGKYKFLFALIGGLRNYSKVINNIDLLIHLGEISGDYYGTRINAKQVWRVNEDGEIRDTFRKLTCVFEMRELDFFNHYCLEKHGDDSFLVQCKDEYSQVLSLIPQLPFSNIWIAKEIATKLPQNSVLHLGILNSLRAWNFFEVSNSIDTYCNVGGFGIDGILSTLVGASLCNPDKTYFGVLGDLAFFYDMNSLGNRHVGRNLRIMLINNGKGTEFRHYTHLASAFADDADKYIAAGGHYGNKSPFLIKHYAEDLGFFYLSASNKDEFLEKSKIFLSATPLDKSVVFEVFTNSLDESNALDIMLNFMNESNPFSIREEVKKFTKSFLGEKLISKLRNRK